MTLDDLSFVVIGPNRSGSTLFCWMLNEHPNVECKFEYFNKLNYGRYSKKYNTTDPIKILENLLEENWENPEHVKKDRTGFKFLFPNNRPETNKLYEYLLKCHKIKKILITRNPLEKYISERTVRASKLIPSTGPDGTITEYRAQFEKDMGRPIGKTWLGDKSTDVTITFNKDDFLRFVEGYNLSYSYALRLIKGPLITIDYIDTCNTTAQERVYNFLDIPYKHIHLPDWGHGTTKQNETQMSYRVKNFSEMVEYISTTPYKQYLI